MGRPSKYSDRESVKSKIWQCVLYPDSQSYDCVQVVENIKSLSIWYAFILHNQDNILMTDIQDSVGSENQYTDSDLGLHKKDHFHCVFQIANNKQLGLMANLIGLPSNYLQKTDNKVGSIQYLTHKNNPEKHQYGIDEITTNIQGIKRKYFADEDSIVKANIILEFINNSPYILTITQVSIWACDQNCWDEFRRGQHIFTAVIKEHNELLKGIS